MSRKKNKQLMGITSIPKEVKRFILISMLMENKGISAIMPYCPVDVEWEIFLNKKRKYTRMCYNAIRKNVDKINLSYNETNRLVNWTSVYEQLYGKLPEVWFRDPQGYLNHDARDEYLKTGLFFAKLSSKAKFYR